MGSISMTTAMPPTTTITTLSHVQPEQQPQNDLPTYKTPWIRTPLLESRSLSSLAGCRILLKLENTQPSGSFKSRAMGAQILSHLYNPLNQGKRIHFFASSGGNAGLAAVCAAKTLGFPCTVVVPVQTKSLMVEKLVKAGAKRVVKHGETFAEAGDFMRDVVMQEKEPESTSGSAGEDESEEVVKIALHPFDAESIWEGNSTLIDELVEQVPSLTSGEEGMGNGYQNMVLPVDAIVCSVGGGGLLNGLVMGLERRRRQLQQTKKVVESAKPTHLLAVETRGTDSLASAVKQGELVSLPKITSQATSLGAIRVSERTLQYALHPPEGVKVHSTVFSDADAARGVLRLVDEERVLVELACGVCVEAAVGDAYRERDQGSAKASRKRKRVVDEGYGDDRLSAGENESEEDENEKGVVEKNEFQSRLKELIPDLGPESRVVIVVCGGSNVTIDAAVEWRAMLKDGWGTEN